MAKPEQVLQISPQNELRFRGPFNVPVTSYMKLTNPSDKKILFKIKTTAPKKYCVRPNSGALDPHSTTEIMICLQPFIFDPLEKYKHKFMVQTVFAPDGDVNLEQLWKDITPEQLMDSKLKCVFELPAEQNDTKEQDVAKVSPKAPVQTAVSNTTEGETKKSSAEGDHAEELSALRRENLELREEILRLKHAAGAAYQSQPTTMMYSPPEQPQIDNIHYIYYLVTAVMIAIAGIIVGKLL